MALAEAIKRIYSVNRPWLVRAPAAGTERSVRTGKERRYERDDRPRDPHPLPPSQEALRKASTDLLDKVEAAEQELSGSYRSLAQEGLDGAEVQTDKEVQENIDALRTIGNDLKQAHQRVSAMGDELNARFRDMQKSRDRKWYRLNPPANGAIDLAERRQKHFAQGINLYKLLLVCFVGSFAGVVVESLWCLLRHGYLESRAGLVYGPFNLLYGAGTVTLTIALYRFRNRGPWLSFLGGMLVGSVVEYVCSWGQEALFGSRSWDYSAMPLQPQRPDLPALLLLLGDPGRILDQGHLSRGWPNGS